ncbi:MAG: FkbM family methyltransferase [Clostridia bacterium]|nr:FkbM family methyltransferase [Clostridia bacterium]
MTASADLWQYLTSPACAGRPILLYGMGNGGDKLHAVCAQRGIPLVDCFASDDFVRGQHFHGRRVLTYAEAKAKYGQIIVLVAFATSRPEVLARISAIAQEQELYIPDLPAYGETLFDSALMAANRKAISDARAMLADEASRSCFDAILEAKRTGSLAWLEKSTAGHEDTWRNILHPECYQITADLGAYTGDTIRQLLPLAPNLQEVWAMEPDRKTYAKLCKWGEENPQLSLHACEAGAWSEPGTMCFSHAGGRGAAFADSGRQVAVDSLDNLVGERQIDYIKYDVEGAEYEALLGSAKTIARCRPEMLISLYHRAEDLWRLPMLMRSLCPNYRFYLRRMPGIPAWDINLYAIPE